MGRVNIRCRSCGAVGLASILDLGLMPLANALPTPIDLSSPDPRYPLEVAVCTACSLVQITEELPPEALFREYLYFSSFSDALVAHAGSLVRRTIAARDLGPSSLAVEIASNDGYLLQHYVEAGVPVLGIEPARNVAEVAIAQRGVETISEFFTNDLAVELAGEGRQADVLHASNVLAHVPDLNGFVRGIATILKPEGIAFIEVPYVKDLLDRCEFDTIYHEHLCYFSLTALDSLFRRHGLVVQDVERTEIHGGSLRLHVTHAAYASAGPRVCSLLSEEAGWSVGSMSPYLDFADRVGAMRDALVHSLARLKSDGCRIAAYGAAAKGAILLNYCGIGPETIDFVADRSTWKQGRFIPGVRIPIVTPEALLTEQPDYCLLLAWNFADEIIRQQDDYLRAGGRFILPAHPTSPVGASHARQAA